MNYGFYKYNRLLLHFCLFCTSFPSTT